MSELRTVRRSTGAKRSDIVFIHGFRGNATSCWRAKNGVYWPEILYKHFPMANVWVYDYEAAAHAWTGGHAMFIEDRADNLLHLLATTGIGDKPIILICHSYGGLVAKQLVVQATSQKENKALGSIIENICGIIFLGTPHEGHKWADRAFLLKYIISTTPIIDELQSKHPTIEFARAAFASVKRELGIRCQALYETKDFGGFRVPRPALDITINSFDQITPVECDHFDISRPGNADDEVFVFTMSFIFDTLKYRETRLSPEAYRKMDRLRSLSGDYPDIIGDGVISKIVEKIIAGEV